MTKTTSITVMFSAGESSGDQHAANMYTELKKQIPAVKGLGMGGTKMLKSGIELVYDSSNIAVIGLFEVIMHYAEIRRALKLMKTVVNTKKPDLLICVDYKEFNLKLARFAKQQGIKVLFYVSPQVWAWRPGRVVSYGKAIDMMAVIFPFEKTFYEVENIPVRYVGHPSVDKVHPIREKLSDFKEFSLDSKYPVIGILPGSRKNEIKRILPVMVQAAEELAKLHQVIQFLLPQADSISDELIAKYLSGVRTNIKVIKNQPYDVIQCCDAIMTTSGTATLEIALLQVPMVIAYKLSAVTFFLGKHLVNTKFIGLPNIVAGKGIIKELIQRQLTVENLVNEIDRILTDKKYKDEILAELAVVKENIGPGGGSKKMAELALEMISA